MTHRANDMPLTPLSLEHFHAGVDAGTLVAEASDFGRRAFHIDRLYNDACDVGIAVRSHVTGRIVRFVLANEETRDGDVLAWHFTSIEPGIGTRLTVFND